MLHVVLDTSVYRANPRRNSPPFRALTRLAHAGKVQIHLPDLVKREFLSQQYERVAAELKDLHDHAARLRRTTSSKNLVELAETVLEASQLEGKTVQASADEELDEWLKATNAAQEPLTAKQVRRAFRDYFAGAPPFKKARNRDDIPDGIIFHLVLELGHEHEGVHFVVEDNALHAAAAANEHVAVHKKLGDFIQSPPCQKALNELSTEVAAANLKRLIALLPSREEDLASETSSAVSSALDGRDVTDPQIPDDNNEAIVMGVGEPTAISQNFDEVELYGEDEIGVSFECLVECSLNYAIFKSDYHVLDDSKADRISIGERNDHYYDADEDYTLRVEGTLSLKLDGDKLEQEDLTDEDLEDLIAEAEYDVDMKAVSVETQDSPENI